MSVMYPKPIFGNFYELYGAKTPFLWVQKTQIEFYHVGSTLYIIILKRSNAKMALLKTKCQIIAACVPFVNFWYGTIPYPKLFF